MPPNFLMFGMVMLQKLAKMQAELQERARKLLRNLQIIDQVRRNI